MAEKQTDDQREELSDFPVETWIPHPVSDSAEYLDRAKPKYRDDLTDEQRVEFDKAAGARKPKP